MREIANKVLEFYPNHIESLSNLSITYLLTGEFDKGIESLLKAEKINPKDYIVLGNIAQGYKMKGNKKKAVEYYKKAVKFDYLRVNFKTIYYENKICNNLCYCSVSLYKLYQHT